MWKNDDIFLRRIVKHCGRQGRYNSESTRSRRGPRLVSRSCRTPYVKWVCCWFSPDLALKLFPGYSYMYFPFSSTTNISKFRFDQEWYTKNHYVHVAHFKCYFFISSFFFFILVILQWLHKTFVIILHFDKWLAVSVRFKYPSKESVKESSR